MFGKIVSARLSAKNNVLGITSFDYMHPIIFPSMIFYFTSSKIWAHLLSHVGTGEGTGSTMWLSMSPTWDSFHMFSYVIALGVVYFFKVVTLVFVRIPSICIRYIY